MSECGSNSVLPAYSKRPIFLSIAILNKNIY
nr:MAG TPA: hypothetical protein [Caudoviricetes sp.]